MRMVWVTSLVLGLAGAAWADMRTADPGARLSLTPGQPYRIDAPLSRRPDFQVAAQGGAVALGTLLRLAREGGMEFVRFEYTVVAADPADLPNLTEEEREILATIPSARVFIAAEGPEKYECFVYRPMSFYLCGRL